MEYERKGVTIIWQIEDVKSIHLEDMELFSPVISVDVLDGTKWVLGLLGISTSTIWMTIKREREDNCSEIFELHYEFSVKTLNGTLSSSSMMCTYGFEKGESCPEVMIHMETMRHRKAEILSISDTITIQCKMWGNRRILKSVQFFTRTRMRTIRHVFVGVIEHFSSFTGNEKKNLKKIWSSTGEIIMSVDFFLLSVSPLSHVMKIEITPVDNQTELFCNFKILILDSLGNKTDIGKRENDFTLKSSVIHLHIPSVWKEDLMEYADLYLPNDTLSFDCEITFCSLIEHQKVERVECETDSVDEINQTGFSKEVESLLCKKGILSDVKIKTAREIFPANIKILSAHSPVFEAMFKATMKESIQNCIHIEDLEEITVKHMLLFLYSNTLEELEWKDAIKLYIAADKYLIVSLKSECIELLKQNISLSNCLVLLLLGDLHQDEDLIDMAKCYIARFYGLIHHCDQWREFKNNFSELAAKIIPYPFSCIT